VRGPLLEKAVDLLQNAVGLRGVDRRRDPKIQIAASSLRRSISVFGMG